MTRILLIVLFTVSTIGVYAQKYDVGDVAPEISQPSPEGEMVALSSLRGKVVLIDFWASWCGPCRKENPALIEAYNRFKDDFFVNGDGFEIYSVSLDSNKEAWLKAIADDELNWSNQVSELKGWRNSAALQYGINGIPANLLIDGDGTIIAVNLRGDRLKKELRKQRRKNRCGL